MASLADARKALKRVFGFNDFRPFQSSVIESVLAGHDTLAVSSTGSGKSVLFQIPALVMDGCVIVISPLIALMSEQVTKMQAVGIKAYAFTSLEDKAESKAALRDIRSLELIYTSPEKMRTKEFRTALNRCNISMIAFDEAHCHPSDGIIDTPNGPRRADKIKVGDSVLSLDPDGKIAASKVTAINTRMVKSNSIIGISIDGGEYALNVTGDHPIFTELRGWVRADSVKEGEYVIAAPTDTGNMPDMQDYVQGRVSEAHREIPGNVFDSLRRGVAEPEVRSHVEGVPRLRAYTPTRIKGSESKVLFARVSEAPHRETARARLRRLRRAFRSARSLENTGYLYARMQDGESRKGAQESNEDVRVVRRDVQSGRPLLDSLNVFGGVRVEEKEGSVRETDDRAESDENGGVPGEGIECFEEQGASSPRARRQRARADYSATEGTGLVPLLTTGIRSPVEGREGRPLQAGRCVSAEKGQYRSGRPLPRYEEGVGCPQGCATGRGGLARVTRVERGHYGKAGNDEAADIKVFSFSVSGQHRYFASGVLVHNCMSTWAGFRSSYVTLAEILEDYPDAVRLACTATADAQIEEDITRIVKLRDPKRFISSPWRSNIKWKFETDAHVTELIEQVQRAEGSQIVYASSRREVESVCDILKDAGITAAYYHAGMDVNLRTETQNLFTSRDIPCMVATSAFGMGIDVSDIRLVAMWQLPSSLFDLAQNVGRASRDGEPALGWVRLGNAADKSQRFFIELGNPKLKMYTNLWKAFAKHDKALKWTRDTLMRVTGISDPMWAGQLDAAVAFLEFTGHIETAGCGSVYRLPIINRARASRIASNMKGARVVDGSVIYEVPPGGTDQAALLYGSGACTFMAPSPATIIKPLLSKLLIKQDDLDQKRWRAEDGLEMIYRFAKAGNKQAFMEKAFLR